MDNTSDLKREWSNLFDLVSNTYERDEGTGPSSTSNESVKEYPVLGLSSSRQLPSASYLREALIASGLRPKCELLNLLLDAISLKFVDLERKTEEQHLFKRVLDPDITQVRLPPSSTASNFHTAPNDDDELTDDDDAAFFKSPSIMKSYQLRVLECANKKSPCKINSTLPSGLLKQTTTTSTSILPPQWLTPERAKQKPEEHKPGGSGVVRRQLHLESQFAQERLPPPLTQENSGLRNDLDDDDSDETFLENSIITLDATPPPPPKLLSRRAEANMNTLNSSRISLEESPASFDATILPSSSRSNSAFVITASKKKEAWVDLDKIAQKAAAGRNNTQKKKLKQSSLLSLTRNIPAKKVDVTTLKEYNGGSWTSSSTNSETRVKRKSDEEMETREKRDKLDSSSLSETMFEVSPIKIVIPAPGTPLSPLKTQPSTSGFVQNEPSTCTTKPLSPSSKTNIMVFKGEKTRAAGGKRKEVFESTMDLIKDFDKIPGRSPTSSTMVTNRKGGRGNERRVAVDCERCKLRDDGLESQMNEDELARIDHTCIRVPQPRPKTPDDYWDTKAPSTEVLYRDGYIKVAPYQFTPIARVREPYSDESDFEVL